MCHEHERTAGFRAGAGELHRLAARNQERFPARTTHPLALGSLHAHLARENIQRLGSGKRRNGPGFLDSRISEILLGFQAANSRAA